MNNTRGFTLIEIVITIVIVGIISGIAAMIIAEGVRAYSAEQVRSDVHYQARLAMERMTREIRMIRSSADITTLTDTDLVFVDTSGNTVGFNGTALPDVRRWDGAANSRLATDISMFDFNYFRQDGSATMSAADVWLVEINFTSLQGSESLQMRTRVHPRNF